MKQERNLEAGNMEMCSPVDSLVDNERMNYVYHFIFVLGSRFTF